MLFPAAPLGIVEFDIAHELPISTMAPFQMIDESMETVPPTQLTLAGLFPSIVEKMIS